MNQSSKTTSRKKMLLWGAALLSSIPLLKLFSGKTTPKTNTVKMLTEDGKLVEVDITNIQNRGNKISDTEIHDWIKPQQKS